MSACVRDVARCALDMPELFVVGDLAADFLASLGEQDGYKPTKVAGRKESGDPLL